MFNRHRNCHPQFGPWFGLSMFVMFSRECSRGHVVHSNVMLNVVTSLTPAVSSNEVMIASTCDKRIARHACAVF